MHAGSRICAVDIRLSQDARGKDRGNQSNRSLCCKEVLYCIHLCDCAHTHHAPFHLPPCFLPPVPPSCCSGACSSSSRVCVMQSVLPFTPLCSCFVLHFLFYPICFQCATPHGLMFCFGCLLVLLNYFFSLPNHHYQHLQCYCLLIGFQLKYNS